MIVESVEDGGPLLLVDDIVCFVGIHKVSPL